MGEEREVKIEDAMRIDGWMKPVCLAWLAAQAKQHRLIAEVGSWKGRSTRALADNTPGVVYAIDTWRGSAEHQGMLGEHSADWLFKEFEANTKGCANVHPIPMASVDAAQFLKGLEFDMIFVDAGHDYENVKADILAWWPHLADNGLFAGHDYNTTDVFRAVNERFSVVKKGPDTIWYVGYLL